MKQIETDNRIAKLELELKHRDDKEELKEQISSLKLELQMKKTEVAEERERVAKLEAIISNKKAEEVEKERIKQKKKVDELQASLSSLTLADSTSSKSLSDDLTGLTLNIDRETNSGPGVSSTNLD